jgi:starvation-inducible DNA-binding protein
MSTVTDALNRNLAAMLALHLCSKQAHWNTRGLNFFQTHKLFDRIANRTEDYADTLGEAIAFFQEEAVATPATIAKSYIGPYKVGIAPCEDHLTAILKCLGTTNDELAMAIKVCLDAQDQVTADVFIEIGRGVQKDIYFVQAHL